MKQALLRCALPALGVATVALYLVWEGQHGQVAPDFHYGLYRQSKDLLATGAGFDPPGTAVYGQNHVYTVFAALLAVPLTLLPVGVAEWLITALLIAAGVAAVYVLGVRDLRVYGVLFLWPAVLSGFQRGNLTLPLALAAAVAWRCRGRRLLPGLIVGLAAATKVFMWPLVIWLAATRRFAAAGAAAGVGAASVLLMIPFGNPLDYFRLAARVSAVMGRIGYSTYVLFGGGTAGRLVWLAVASVALLAAGKVGYGSRFSPGSDRASFTFAVVACVLCSPIVWIDYFALLLLPLSIGRPRLGALWLAPLLLWLGPFGRPASWQIVVALGVLSLVVAVLVSDEMRLGRLVHHMSGSTESELSGP